MTLDYRNPNDRKPEPTVDELWRRFLFFRWLMTVGYVLLFFVCAPAIVIIVLLQPTSPAGRVAAQCVALLFATAWAMAAIGSIRCALWRCPHCDKRFTRTWWYNWPWRRSCAHCGWRPDSALDGIPFQPSKR